MVREKKHCLQTMNVLLKMKYSHKIQIQILFVTHGSVTGRVLFTAVLDIEKNLGK